MRTLLVTGGCGFIGSHFVRAAVGLGTFDAVNLDSLTYAGEPARLANVAGPYAASKASADLLVLAYGRTYDLPVLIVRSTNNYGPFQFPEKLVPLTIRNALAGADLPLYGDGGQRREWLYVEDNCRAIVAILQSGQPGSIYNVGAGEAPTNLEIVRALCRVLAEEAGLKLESILRRVRFMNDRPGHDRRYAVDSDKIRHELAWRPHVPLNQGLRRTVRWYLDHKQWLDRIDSAEYRSYYEAVYVRNWERPGRQCESR